MNANTFPAPQIFLHWIRETPSRGLQHPVSQTLNSLDSLPVCVQDAIRATGLDTLEVHLPPYIHEEAGSEQQWLDSLRFRQDAAGRLIATRANDPNPLATMAFHQATVLALHAITDTPTRLTIVGETPESMVLPQPLAVHCECAPGGTFRNAPGERSKHYFFVYRRVSLAMQAALRRVLPPAHIGSMAAFEDVPHTQSLLAWSAARCVVGQYVDQIAVDVLDVSVLSRAQSGMQANLANALRPVHDALVRTGASEILCRSYEPRRASAILEHIFKYPKYLRLLFANEFRVIQAFVQLCTRIEEWQAIYPSDPARVYREIRNSWEDVESLLRRFYRKQSQAALGNVLLVEAVRAMEALD